MDWESITTPQEMEELPAETGFGSRESGDIDLEASQPGPSCMAQTETMARGAGQSLERDNPANSDAGASKVNQQMLNFQRRHTRGGILLGSADHQSS